MLILLCDAPWKKRASLLFLVFQGIGTEEMGHEDFILAAQVIAVALCRLWEASMWNPKSLTTLSESIADNAFTKVRTIRILPFVIHFSSSSFYSFY